MVTAYRLDQQGGALVDVFATYVAEQRKNDAAAFWRQRLFAKKVADEMRKEIDLGNGGGGSSGANQGESGDRSFPSKPGEGSK
eukprot:4587253-Heterocapsa_arctica.AAC.1